MSTHTSHSSPTNSMPFRDGTPCFSLKWENDWWDMTRRRTVRYTLGVRPSAGQAVLRGVLRCPHQNIYYVALGEGVKHALFTGAVLSFVCLELSGSFVRGFEDNQGAIVLAANPLSSARNKGANTLTCISISLESCFVQRRLTFSL